MNRITDVIKVIEALVMVLVAIFSYRLMRQDAWNREVRNRLEALEKERELRLEYEDQQDE